MLQWLNHLSCCAASRAIWHAPCDDRWQEGASPENLSSPKPEPRRYGPGPRLIIHTGKDRGRKLLPLPQLHLPYLFNADLGPRDLDALAAALLEGIGALQESSR